MITRSSATSFPMMEIKLATLNLCLGLKRKKDLVKKNILIENKLDILCVQESEIEETFDKKLLNIPGFILELENNSKMSRVGMYVSKNLKYKRQLSLEGTDSNIVILDILGKNNFVSLTFTEVSIHKMENRNYQNSNINLTL